MRYVICICLLLVTVCSAGSESATVKSLPKSEDIFTIAINPIPSLSASRPRYFTADSLREALPNFRPGKAEIKAGARCLSRPKRA
jgi:hypothetical protein